MNSDKIKYVFPKLSNRLRLYRNKFWSHCNVGRIAMSGYKPFDNAMAFKRRIHNMLGEYDVNILVGIKDDERNLLLSTANQALRHEFDLLGSGPVVLNPIDWHADFKTGARWDKRYYQEINRIKGADIKVPWELSRCQQLLWLGEAYLLTGKKDYAKEIIEEINWWIDDNPFMYSVNWVCSMDVAFRAVNWIFSLNMISSYEGFDNFFTEKVSRSLWEHGFFIRNNLERLIPYSNNHYASDIVGLLYIGALFNETSKGKRWFKLALKEFYTEIKVQVLESGVHYERSVSYHRMMTEMLSYSIYMLHRIGEHVPMEVRERVKRMYDYVSAYTKPNGLAPLVGDNDDGRFVPLLKRDYREHNYLTNRLSVENRFVTLGIPMLFTLTPNNCQLNKDAGCAVVKRNGSYLFINNGGYSKCTTSSDMLIQTHTHNDLLSFDLCFDGKDIIVDPGAYLYTSSIKDRNTFRSGIMHNTVVVDNEEQNEFISAFTVKRNVIIGQLLEGENGIYEGDYTTINGGLNHHRSFNFSEEELVVNDKIMKRGEGHVARFYFHFAEGIIPSVEDSTIILNEGVKMNFSLSPLRLDIIDGKVSPSYGVLKQSKMAVVEYAFDNEITVATTIKKH